MGELKHIKYKYIKYNGKANTYWPGYFCANMFLVSCFMFCDVLAMCGVPYEETVLLTDQWWLAII